MNLLALFPHALWHRKVSPTRRHAVRAVSRQPGVRLHLTGSGWPDWDLTATVEANARRIMPDADAIWWYKPLGSREAPPLVKPHECGLPAVETLNECWWPDDRAVREIIAAGSTLVVCHHANDVSRFAKTGQLVEVVHIPHAAEVAVFAAGAKPWDDRTIDVLLTGSLNREHYPLRCRLADLMRRGKLPGRCHLHPRPPLRAASLAECECHVREYAGMVGRSKIALGCSSRWRYPLAHYPEKAMAGARVVADMPELAPPGYDRMVEPIDPAWTDQQIVARIGELLADDEALRLAAQIGQAVALRFYTMDCYAARFLEAVRAQIFVRP